MRKTLVVLIVLLMLSSSAWAGFLDWGYFTDPANWIPTTGAVGTGNDLFAWVAASMTMI